ncbi:unnamed protein product [Adineta steineri]|uniref:Uncharacterized protein n=1 Tax=Adineta steineri TaxID=433720 RepID=A0A813N4N7_9BILA|nr:unnamed protein product [Adineta steineri]CAF0730270.1 unnamed protein product [Adineta steineri]CAF3878302.1 unnamed protein product [Adineta steineri]CAF3927232.1 unnamed protein product [Adineta steineri]
MAFDNFHCKAATCQEFYHGLKHSRHYQDYINTCYETVNILLQIPKRYGKCVDDSTMRMNPNCIRALAKTIKKCISQLSDLPENTARFYCGYTLMKHCAVNVGLERFRLNFQSRTPTDD